MNIKTLVKQEVLIVRIEGEIDMHVADEFRQAVDNAINASSAQHLLLNLKGVTFIDSSGLGVILGRYKRIGFLGGKMLVTGIRPQVERLFEFSGLLKLIKTYASEMEALENI